MATQVRPLLFTILLVVLVGCVSSHSSDVHKHHANSAKHMSAEPKRLCPLCSGMEGVEEHAVKFAYGQEVWACSDAHKKALLSSDASKYVKNFKGAREAAPSDAKCPLCGMDAPKMLPVEYKEGQKVYTCQEEHQEALAKDPYLYLDRGSNPPMSMMMQMYFENTINAYVLFKSWYTDSYFTYFVALIGTFLGGLFHQGLVRFRFLIKNPRRSSPSYQRMEGRARGLDFFAHSLGMHFVRTIVYGLTTTLSYLLMLIAMTFNTGLFMAVILGLSLGFFLFSTEGTPGAEEDKFGCCEGSGGFSKGSENHV